MAQLNLYTGNNMPKGDRGFRTGEELRVSTLSCGKVYTGPNERVRALVKMHRKTCVECKTAKERGAMELTNTSTLQAESIDTKQLLAASILQARKLFGQLPM